MTQQGVVSDDVPSKTSLIDLVEEEKRGDVLMPGQLDLEEIAADGVDVVKLTVIPPQDMSHNEKLMEDGKSFGHHSNGNNTEAKPGLFSVMILFRYATWIDWLLMFIGTLCAILHGIALPAAMLVFGRLTNVFVNQFTALTLANTVFTFDPVDFIGDGRFATVDPNIIASGIIDFKNITGGSVNCSEEYELLRFGLNFDEVLALGVTELAICIDNTTFIRQVLIFVYIFIAIGVGVLLLGHVQVMTFQLACERQVFKIQRSYYRAILRQDISWFYDNPTGELASRLSDDIEKIHDGIGDKLAILIQWVATFFAGFAIGFSQEWRLTLFMLGVTPFIAILTTIFAKLITALTVREQKDYGQAGAVAEEVLSAIRTVLAFAGEEKELRRYVQRLKEALTTGYVRGVLSGVNFGVLFLFIFWCYAGAFWFSAFLISRQIVQAGEILTVFFAVLIGAFAIGQAVPNLEKLLISAGSSHAIYSTVDRVPPIDSSSKDGEKPQKLHPVLAFQNVSFVYSSRPDVPVLGDVSFEVSEGQTVALVGPSGSGKSTIISLLLRFYDTLSGQVLVGGHDVRSLNLEWLRSHIGIVSQEPVLFDTTIIENIRLGKRGASIEEIEQAAQDANVHDFIVELPNGYNTLVGERGTQLSGGQKQRIAIARALVGNPQILLLDEATSALDSESEAIVQNALDRARQGRTTVIIAHRLSTIRNADYIIAIDHGCVIEKGSHDELMGLSGLYYQLVTAQLYGDADEMNLAALSEKFKKQSSIKWSPQKKLSLKRQNSKKRDVPLARDEKTSQVSSKQQQMWDEELSDVAWRRILALSANEWYLLTLGIIGAAVQGAIFPVFAIFFAKVLEVFTFPSDRVLASIHMWAGLLAALGVISGIAQFLKTACFGVAGEKLTFRLRSLSFKAMLRQDLSWFDEERNSTGALTTRLASDAGQVQGATGTRLGSLIETIFGMLTAVAVALAASWLLTFVVLSFVPLLVIAGSIQLKVLTGFATGYKKAVEHAGKIAVDSIDNIRTVAALTVEDEFYSLYRGALHHPYKRALVSTLVYGFAYGFSQCMLFFGYALTFGFAAYQSIQTPTDWRYARFDEIFQVFIAIIFGALAVGQASAFAPNYAKARLSARRIFALLDHKPLIDNSSTEGLKPDSPHGGLSLSQVAFNYPARPGVKVLDDVTFDLVPGQTLALVGPSGCGKSTVALLLERFYDVGSGHVYLDGIDVRDLNVGWLRAQIGVVFQEPVLLDTSVADNIRYGANFREVSDEEVLAAAMAANIHTFVESLPEGYSTNVGDKGTQLSGGQKQRVAIARALVRNPKVLVLDEATSALDTESEAVVQEALDRARQGRTSIVIAHRLSTIHNADCIAVIQAGRIIEKGTHSALIARHGVYYKLNSYQLLTTEEEEEEVVLEESITFDD